MEVNNEILNFMDWAGIQYKIEGREAYTTAHDSLKIPLKPGKEYFTWYSNNKWGHLPEFIMNFDGDGFKPAPNKREAYKLIKAFRASGNGNVLRKFDYDYSEVKKFDFASIALEKEPYRTMRYLFEKRNLEPRMIRSLLKSGLIAEEKSHHNILFLWRDSQNRKVGADVQGTVLQTGKKRPYFKMIEAGSKEDFGWSFNFGHSESIDKIVLTEAPIDTLSYFQSFGKNLPNTTFASLSGSASKIKSVDNLIDEHITKHGNMAKEIHIAVDNDAAGHKLINKMKEEGWKSSSDMQVLVDIPKFGKDWNEMLQKGKIGKYSVDIQNFDDKKFPVIKEKQRNIQRDFQRSYTKKRSHSM